ncbi:MAG: S-adenosylmethionine:tRNA ribosyltransferase-isomerase [Cyclobacteriaceae bacterium]
MDLHKIAIDDYDYPLPQERIAKFPLAERDQSKLLVYENGKIEHHQFFRVTELLPENSLIFFNDTKVIPARLIFQKSSGASIEIIFLNPYPASADLQQEMQRRATVTWQCMIGNKKRWKDNEKLEKEIIIDGNCQKIIACWHQREDNLVRLAWQEDITFAKLLESIGEVPLPPYLQRKATAEDKPRYQTVYSKHEGAIAAPTAGLHFTDNLMAEIEKKHKVDYLTLHVGAGTFQPVKHKFAAEHPMHSEQIVIRRHNLENILQSKGPTVAVGTTSMRTLESIYWYGVKILNGNEHFQVEKLIAYQDYEQLPAAQEAIMAILQLMKEKNTDYLIGHTEIYIFPGYEFKMVDALITNYHLPKSTLILLIAAFVGEDWRKIYQAALHNQYRFLSYGDSSLLFKK